MVGVGSGKVLSSPNSAPLTYKDGTALALSCMADYGAPVFPFLAVGGYKGKLRPPQEASEWTYGAGVMDRRMGVAMGTSRCLGVAGSVEGSWGRQTCPSCIVFLSLTASSANPAQVLWFCAWNHRFCL